MARPGSRSSSVCDCGSPKQPGREACGRCSILDGEKPRRAQVIAAFRNLDGNATLLALVLETGLNQRKVSEELAAMLVDGQVERLETESEWHKNQPRWFLRDSCPARVLVGEQTAFRRFEKYLEPVDLPPRPPAPPKPEPKPRPDGWVQAILALSAMRRRVPKPKPSTICDECREIIHAGRAMAHAVEKHGAEPLPVKVVIPDVLPGQTAWC